MITASLLHCFVFRIDLIHNNCLFLIHLTEPPSKPKPSRPASAKTSSSSTGSATAAHNQRVASAGTVRRGPFLRPQPPSQPSTTKPTNQTPKSQSKIPTAKTNTRNAEYQNGSVSKTSTTVASNVPPHHQFSPPMNQPTEQITQPNGKGAVYGTNGLRLDRTPTDDEINWLWEKVRTCLHPEGSDQNVQQPVEQPTARQTATVHTKFIDGTNLIPQNKRGTAAMRVTSATQNMNGSHYGNHDNNNVPTTGNRKKVTTSVDTFS